jgi:hypothetical protein
MARARNIKPGFFKNEVLGVADPFYSLLFEGLWVLADRAGRLEDRPLRIKGEVFPYRDGLDIESMLVWLQENGFIRRYSVDGKGYILVLEFVKHQNPHKNEVESILPPPDEIGTASELIGPTRADCGFLIPDSLIPERDADASPPAKKSKPKDPECPEDVNCQVWADWLALRRKKSAPVTQTVIDGARREAEKAGMAFTEFLRVWCVRGSQGLQAEWLTPKGRSPPNSTVPSSSVPDPALAKLDRDALMTKPPSIETLARMAELRRGAH